GYEHIDLLQRVLRRLGRLVVALHQRHVVFVVTDGRQKIIVVAEIVFVGKRLGILFSHIGGGLAAAHHQQGQQRQYQSRHAEYQRVAQNLVQQRGLRRRRRCHARWCLALGRGGSSGCRRVLFFTVAPGGCLFTILSRGISDLIAVALPRGVAAGGRRLIGGGVI